MLNESQTVKKEKKKKETKLSKKRRNELEKERELLIKSLEDAKSNERSDKENVYRYVVMDSDGTILSGTMTGFSKLDVMSYLVNQNYKVYSIKTSKTIEFVYGNSSILKRKMSNKELIFWLTQLSTYVKSGIPLAEAVKILGKQLGKKGKRKKLFESINYNLNMGDSFSEALAKQGGVFPPLLVNMLRAAEATGELEKTLDDMANYYDEMEKTIKQMKSAMTYPTIITVFALAVVTFISIYVVPQFVGIYDQIGAKINPLTQAVINISSFLKQNISFILLGLVALGVANYLCYKKIKKFRYCVQYVLMHTPVIKDIIIYNEIAIFTKTFASLLKNNVFITDSMEILSKITNNEIYREIMFDTISNISRGEKISLSFKDHWAIPDVAYYMIVTGESTGELADMMNRVSLYYQEEHRNVINTLKSIIEPVMIIFLAVVVGIIIIAIIIPMFQLYSEIS